MDVSHPYKLLSSVGAAAVLVELHNAAMPLSGREIARRSGHPQSGVSRSLKQLVQSGLVVLVAGGYVLNESHVLAPAVSVIATARLELVSRIRRVVEAWEPSPPSVVLFGSTARRDGDDRSDIDLLLVRPDGVAVDDPSWDDNLASLAAEILTWTGNSAELVDYSKDDVVAASGRPGLFDEIARDGIVIVGVPPRELALRSKHAKAAA